MTQNAPFALAPHPLLDLAWLSMSFPAPLEQLPSPRWLTEGLALGADVGLARPAEVKTAVRDLLRHGGGYKPAGRGKPASEYLLKAAEAGRLGSINAAVDVCNVVSLHGGLPISVVDLDRAAPPLRVGLAPAEASYVFNAGGQEIRFGGLLCLADAGGPCANPVKDSQRTKTGPATTRALALIWGTQALPGHAARSAALYADLLRRLGAEVEGA